MTNCVRESTSKVTRGISLLSRVPVHRVTLT
jgi:hypothetical protein